MPRQNEEPARVSLFVVLQSTITPRAHTHTHTPRERERESVRTRRGARVSNRAEVAAAPRKMGESFCVSHFMVLQSASAPRAHTHTHRPRKRERERARTRRGARVWSRAEVAAAPRKRGESLRASLT